MRSLNKRSTLSLRLRVIFAIILLLVLIGATFSFLTVRSIHQLVEEVMWGNYSSYSRSFAAFSAKSFAEGDVKELHRHLVVALAQPDMIFVVARDQHGEVVAQVGNFESYQPLDIHKKVFEDDMLSVQEIGAKPGGLFHASGHTFLITARVLFEGKEIGTVQLAVSTASANQKLASISFWGFKMALAVVAIGTIILIFVDRRLRKNIAHLIQITRSMATGDLSQRVEIKTGDEIEHLGDSFNMMAEAIRTHEVRLEKLVERRTKELADEKNILQLILDNVPSAFIMLDNNLRVLSVSAQLEAVLHQQREEVLGKVCALCTLLYESHTQCPTRLALRHGEIQLNEARLMTSSGEEKFIEHMAVPIKRNGEIKNILEIITDISDRKRFEEHLVRTEKLSATGEMAASIAHEMRNSLTSVNLILQCLTDSVGQNEEDAKSLEIAIASVNRTEAIVRQLLEFAKPGEIKFEKADISSLVEQSLEFCKYQFQKKQIRLKTNLADSLPPLEADIERMREVLLNLLLNAVDAVKEKGVISIEAHVFILEKTMRDHLDPKSNRFKKGTQAVRLRVRDNGVGISREHLKRIFDPFFTTKTKGTGLGLTMARRIIGEHGGILNVESKVGQGATFTILLPLSRTGI
ncbi:MAG: ATP-binding protein [bacterium]